MRSKLLPKVMPYSIAVTNLQKYEAGEVAHIENVMGTETRKRKHRRLRREEQLSNLEEETTEESERDLESTERFELESEVESVVQQQEEFSAGVSLTASYGFVSVSGHVDYSTSSSSSESERGATKYLKEIVERAVNSIKSRVKTTKEVRLISEVEENNKHSFVNVNPDHVVGVYRWVDKLYRLKKIPVGMRMVYDFNIPEPAAFYLFSKLVQAESGAIPTEPVEPHSPYFDPPLHPRQITESTYLAIARQVEAEGISGPPPRKITMSHVLSKEFDPLKPFAFEEDGLRVPEGYVPVRAFTRSTFNILSLSGDPGSLEWFNVSSPKAKIVFGTVPGGESVVEYFETHYTDDADYSWAWFYLEPSRNFIPISGTGIGITGFSINIDVEFERTWELYSTWQMQTYDKIMAAYRKSVLDYQDELAAKSISGGVNIRGRNPNVNRKIEREELRKQFISLITDTDLNFGPFVTHDETAPRPDNYPETIRDQVMRTSYLMDFFEGAFEWSNMTYQFHPYFWGDKSTWPERLAKEDSDPIFEAFVKAGQSRVVIPVRPEWVNDVLFYQLTGVVWPRLLGDPPVLPTTGSFYFEYLADLAADLETGEMLEAPEGDIEIADDDPDALTFRVPTNLVWLQESGDLPDNTGGP